MSVVGGEMVLPDRIKYIQGQIRIAIQNHQVLWQRLIMTPQDLEIENMLRMLQGIILSLGRRQSELMYQYKHELRLKYPGDKEIQSKVSLERLGWPDRDEPLKKHVPNGTGADPGKKPTVQIVKRHPNIQLGRPSQKMTSLLKPPAGSAANQQLQRKESERLKAAAARLAETSSPVVTKKVAPGQKPKIVLKVEPSLRRVSNEKLSDSDSFPEVKESELAGYKLTPHDKAVNLSELSQDHYLGFFGLIHKDKSKSMVVSQTKRKRRTAAGQSDFYKDFFQPKRPYNRKTQMAETQPSSSQETTEADSAEFSPPSEKPSVPPSPSSSCSTEVLEESTPREGSPAIEASESQGDTGNQSEEEAKTGQTGDALEPTVEVDEAVKGNDSAADGKPLLATKKLLDTTAKTPLVVGTEPSADVGAIPAATTTAGSLPAVALVDAAPKESLPDTTTTAADERLPSSEESSSAENRLPATEKLPSASKLFPDKITHPVSETLAEESPVREPLPNDNTLSVCETQDPACKEASSESEGASCSAADSLTLPDSKFNELPKTDDDVDCKTPQDESAPPSPTNEDDEDADSSLSPSDLIETETYKIPTAADPMKMESVSSVGEESSGETGVDISAMIGDNVQYFSSDGADCSEVVKRYRLEGQSDESEDEEISASAEYSSRD